MDWPAGQVEQRPIGSLKRADRNARRHSKAQVRQIADSMQRWGWTMPLLIDTDDVIIAGHGRIEAAISLGFDVAPCMIARGWTDEQKRAYALADNKLGLNSTWDDELLRAELTDLMKVTGIDEIGFSAKEVESLIGITAAGAGASQLSDDLQHRVIVECDDEQHQGELLERFAREGLKCRALIS